MGVLYFRSGVAVHGYKLPRLFYHFPRFRSSLQDARVKIIFQYPVYSPQPAHSGSSAVTIGH